MMSGNEERHAQHGKGDAMLEELEIRRLIENWVLWRDAGDWDRFATVWHPNGRIMTTWCQASASSN
jgi:hypothetical protein